MNKNLYLTEAMILYKKKFKNNSLNIINSHAGSGKTNFIFNEFLNNTCNYVDNIKQPYINNLGLILYICDTTILKESVLNDNKNITKVLEKNDLKRAMNNNDLQRNNRIIVITYNSLGFLLNNESSRFIINNYFKCVIMDEIHNLFKYAYRYKDNKNTFYNSLINNLNELIRNKNIITIGMTATPFNKSKATWQTFKSNINENTIFKVVTGRKGTYIIDKNDTLKDILKRGKNNMNNDNELIKYLESIINTKLNKQQQKELINNIGLKDTRGRQVKSINILNAYLIDNYNMSVISKQISENNKRVRYWIVSKIN